jgi:hypothetical protein
MGRQFWHGVLAIGAGGVILVIETLAFFLAGAQSSIALIAGCLVIAIICLILGEVCFGFAWRALGCTALGTVVLSAMIWQNVSLWWWPFGLVALGIGYLALAELFPENRFPGWREALAFSAPFVAGVGAVWELGQVLGAFLLFNQATVLLADEIAALRGSFLLSSLFLLAGSLFWVLIKRRLIGLALTALLAAQLAFALVFNGIDAGNPSMNPLLALALLVVALASHVGTYPLRLTQPALMPGKSASFLGFSRLLRWKDGWATFKEMLNTWQEHESWWLCLLLDGFSLLLCLIAVLPVASPASGGSPDTAALVIVLIAGALLSLSVAYWQDTAWFLLLGGFFVGLDLLTFGAFTGNPSLAWALLYLAAALLLFAVYVWLIQMAERSWTLALLVVVAGYSLLAIIFGFQGNHFAWGILILLALAIALLAFWGWRRRQPARWLP